MPVATLAAPVILDLNIQPRIADVRLASEWLTRSGRAHGIPEDDLGRLDLCLNEALANVLAHGGEVAAAQPIHLQLHIHTSACEAALTLSDAGAAFDATQAPLKPQASSLEDAMPGGLGLLLMRQNSDAQHYQRQNDRNLLTLSVRWGQSA